MCLHGEERDIHGQHEFRSEEENDKNSYMDSRNIYAAECWTMNSADRKKVEAFEMWTWRRMLKISWRDRVTNQEVLKRVEEERILLHMIDRRKHHWLGHVIRVRD